MTDCSGFKNHGVPAKILEHKSGSPRYKNSVVFDGAQYIRLGRTPMVTDAITVSWWGYMDNWANYTRAISCTESGGWNFEPNGSKMTFPLYRNGAYILASDSVTVSTYTAGWHHFVGTYDGYKSTIYVDGVAKGSSAATSTKYPISYYASNGIFIGAEAGGSTTTPAGPYFSGRISDVRIYATALSAADIEALYKIPANLDNFGSIYACSFNEENKIELNKSGIIDSKDFYESLVFNDMEVKTLSDGSRWARILHHNNKSASVLFTSSNVLNIQSTDLYSRLYALEGYRNIDGKFEFMAI